MLPDWAKLKPVNSITTNNTGNSRMITQEMRNAVNKAQRSAFKRGATEAEEIDAIIEEVYPLIRQQVIAELDAEDEKWRHYYNNPASKIRNLKDKTDGQ